jgi:hypothetical protein
MIIIKKAENSENLSTHLDADLIQAICPLHMFEYLCGHIFQILDQVKYPNDLILYFVFLLYKESLEIIPVKNNPPPLMLNSHGKYPKCFTKVQLLLLNFIF